MELEINAGLFVVTFLFVIISDVGWHALRIHFKNVVASKGNIFFKITLKYKYG